MGKVNSTLKLTRNIFSVDTSAKTWKRCTPSVTLQSGPIQLQRPKLRRPSIKNDGTGPDFPTLKERTQLRKRRPPSSVLKPPRNNFVLFCFYRIVVRDTSVLYLDIKNARGMKKK